MAKTLSILIEFRSPAAEEALLDKEAAPLATEESALPPLPGVTWDTSLPLIPMPGGLGAPELLVESFDDSGTAEATWIAAGEVEEADLDRLRAEVISRENVVGLYADPKIDFNLVCQNSPPVGDEAAVAQRLGLLQLHQRGLTGEGVTIAVVDSGSNQAYLRSRGKQSHGFDQANSHSILPDVLPPGAIDLSSQALRHGTMVAFDALIAAPRATLLDIVVVVPGGLQDHLRRVLWGYNRLRDLVRTIRAEGSPFALVVNNSWALSDPAEDLPLGPGSFRNDPNHPVTKMAQYLDSLGVDMVFSAGNCGAGCPFPGCGAAGQAIYGTNSFPNVLCVGAVDVNHRSLGYSPNGPGYLSPRKPDLCGYSHFAGSGLSARDGGTSAAAPVVAGVIAALRSRIPFNPTQNSFPPAFIRQLLRTTAQRSGTAHDPLLGWGVIDGVAAARRANLIP